VIKRETIDGREAFVAYLTRDMEPADEDDAELIKVIFDDGQVMFLTASGDDAEVSGISSATC